MIVVDVNTVLSGLRSTRGASHLLLRKLLAGEVAFAMTAAIALEYESVLTRPGILGPYNAIGRDDIGPLVDALIAASTLTTPWFRFRPVLQDPDDDIYVECAISAGARTIISHDRDFGRSFLSTFGIDVKTARDYLIVNDQGRSK